MASESYKTHDDDGNPTHSRKIEAGEIARIQQDYEQALAHQQSDPAACLNTARRIAEDICTQLVRVETGRIYQSREQKLPFELYQKISEFLASIPNIHDSNTRQALIYRAGLDTQLQNQITFAGPSAQFCELLVSTFRSYGRLEDRRNALEALLESAKNWVGKDRREHCDTLIQESRAVSNVEEHQHQKHPLRQQLDTPWKPLTIHTA